MSAIHLVFSRQMDFMNQVLFCCIYLFILYLFLNSFLGGRRKKNQELGRAVEKGRLTGMVKDD